METLEDLTGSRSPPGLPLENGVSNISRYFQYIIHWSKVSIMSILGQIYIFPDHLCLFSMLKQQYSFCPCRYTCSFRKSQYNCGLWISEQFLSLKLGFGGVWGGETFLWWYNYLWFCFCVLAVKTYWVLNFRLLKTIMKKRF